jgi:uncharacterized small protein (TIGR04563 family)
MTAPANARRFSIYAPVEIADEIEAAAKRLDRSVSWIVQQAWLRARDAIMTMEPPQQHSPPAPPEEEK